MLSTIKLIRVLGSPFELTKFQVPLKDTINLLRLSKKNRILFLYLQRIHPKNLGKLTHLYRKLETDYRKTIDSIALVSKYLLEAEIKHSLFKTVKPYKSTTIDLDIIIFGENEEYYKSLNVLKNAGYKILAHGSMSSTLLDLREHLNIDLYREISASHIIYINKETLHSYVTTTRLPNGAEAKILKPEADLACIIAHSIIKEQMYTLSEYYSFIYYLKQMNINDFIEIIKQNNITSAARTHASLTALLHNVAHKTIPKELEEIVEALGEEKFETARLIQKNFETPHKYHPITVAKCLLEITKNKKTRNSIAMQIYQMLSPNFTKRFLAELIQHIKRETY